MNEKRANSSDESHSGVSVSTRRWFWALAITVGLQLVVFFLIPQFVIATQLARNVTKTYVALALGLLPLCWALYLFARCFRSRPERIVTYFALVTSLFWLVGAVDLALRLWRELNHH